MQSEFNGESVAIDAPKTFRRQFCAEQRIFLSKEKLAEGDDIVGRCVGDDVG